MYIDGNKLLDFLKEFIVFDDLKKDIKSITEMDELIEKHYDWQSKPIDSKTCTDVATDLGITEINRSIVTSVGFSLQKRGLEQIKTHIGRMYILPPPAHLTKNKMKDHEKLSNLYKQELINVKDDLCGIEILIHEFTQSGLIHDETADELHQKIKSIITEITKIFPKVERSE